LYRYCEERPLLLGNLGMGARLCTYYQKKEPNDPTVSSLGSTACNTGMGTLLSLELSDKSPFLGDISPGQTQPCLETNLYRAPVFPHKLGTTDYLLVRSAKGVLSLRRINRLYVVGQQVALFDSYALRYNKLPVWSQRIRFVCLLNLFTPNCWSRLHELDVWVFFWLS
jgi:transcription initiation factor TFIID subunit 1